MSLSKLKGRIIEVTKGEPSPGRVTIRIKQSIGNKVFTLTTQVSNEKELPRLLVSYGKKYKIRKNSYVFLDFKKEVEEEVKEEPKEETTPPVEEIKKETKRRTTKAKKPTTTTKRKYTRRKNAS